MVELDKEQLEVVESDESLIVEAGPGSGKTRVLTEKARKEFNSGKSIICLTFTRSAAREISERVKGLPATTIHSYCHGHVGWKESWGYVGLLYRFLFMKDKPRFDWLLLDEAQDINPIELDVILSMIGDKVFAVGDPYQSIYGFQEAMGLRMMKHLEAMGCKKVPLHNNYRSCPAVVEGLNRIYNRDLRSTNVKDTGLTCILCRTNDTLFEVSRFLKEKEIPHKVRLAAAVTTHREYDVIKESNLRLMTIHASKGHEFDKVILFRWKPDGYTEEETRVYYVAMARASKEFVEIEGFEELRESLVNGKSN